PIFSGVARLHGGGASRRERVDTSTAAAEGSPEARGGAPETSARSVPDLLAPIAIFAVSASVYLSLPTTHYSYDSVASGILLYQGLTAATTARLFPPSPALSPPAAAACDWLLRRIRSEVDPLTLLQVLSSVFAAASLAVHFRLARALGLRVATSTLLTLLL